MEVGIDENNDLLKQKLDVRWYTVVDEMSVDEMSVGELSWNPQNNGITTTRLRIFRRRHFV